MIHLDGGSLEDDVKGKIYDHRLMRRLVPFLRPHTLRLSAALVLILGESALTLAFPYLTMVAIDRYIPTGDRVGLLLLAAALLGVIIAQVLTQFCETWILQTTGQLIMQDLRKRLFGHFSRMPVSYYDRNPVGKIMTRLTSDVDALNELFTSGLISIVGDICTLLGIVGMLLYLNWRLALVVFAVVPLVFVATEMFRRRVRISFRMIRAAVSRMNGFLQEYLTGMPVVQLFGQENRSAAKFTGINRQHLDAFQQTVFYFAVFYPVIEVIGALATALILLHGGFQVMAGMLTLGQMVAFLQYGRRFFEPISDMSEKFNIFQSAMAAAERVFAVLDVEEERRGPPSALWSAPPAPKSAPAIEFRQVSFSYDGEKPVLEDISFKVNRRERVAIVGPTGSGKTTIINLLLRLYRPASGEILLDGLNVEEYPESEIRRRIGLVAQDIFLFSTSISENITLGHPEIGQDRVEEACRQTYVHDFISKELALGYAHKVAERGADLSQGQRQLLSFARALAYARPLLVLDEATSSVDIHTERLIQSGMERLLHGRTALIIAHRLSTIESADRIIVLHKGRIREEGREEELLARRGLYYKFHRLQSVATAAR
ncbi:MAG: ABC transporter ATP-binding protein [Acidobacteriota bacterium]